MPFLAYFGIESSGLNLAIDLLILFVVVAWLALVYFTYADGRRRIYDPMLIGCATAASFLFPFVGTIVYVILRPPEYIEDVQERELEMQLAEARLHELDYALCPHCDYRVQREFIRCPSCLRKLKERCPSCSRALEMSWTICPYCEADVPGSPAARRARRRAALGVRGEADQAERGERGERADRSVGAVEAERLQRPERTASAVDAATPAGRAARDGRPAPVSSSEQLGAPSGGGHSPAPDGARALTPERPEAGPGGLWNER